MIKSILSLVRFNNLLFIVLTQFLIKYALLEPIGATTALDHFHFVILVISTICIAAGGYIINDIFDVDTDTINKPHHLIVGQKISEKAAYNFYIAFTSVGVLLGFYLSNSIEKNGLAVVFVIIASLLYIYASYLKQLTLIGNILISILVAFTIIIIGLFDLVPMITAENQMVQIAFFKIIFTYSLFAFMINFLREIVKDVEDIKGDYNTGMKTLPILLGRQRTINLIFILSFIPLLSIIYYVADHLYEQQFAVIYFLIFVIAPLIYFTIKSYSAWGESELRFLSNFLKIIMLTGVLSLLLYPIILT